MALASVAKKKKPGRSKATKQADCGSGITECVPILITESQSRCFDHITVGNNCCLGLILSAFEELKTGRKVDYQVTLIPSPPALPALPAPPGPPGAPNNCCFNSGHFDNDDSAPMKCTIVDAEVDCVKCISDRPETVSRNSCKKGHVPRNRTSPSPSRAGSEEGRASVAASAASSWKDHSESGQSGERIGSRHSRSKDDRAASQLNLPLTAQDIVNMPVEEFNNYIANGVAHLQSEQIQLMKDIRRRGKNKVAAQNCRRRKIDNMSHLEREIMKLRSDLAAATAHRNRLVQERQSYRASLSGRSSVIRSVSSVPSVIMPVISAPSINPVSPAASGLSLTKRPSHSQDLSLQSTHALRNAKRKRQQ